MNILVVSDTHNNKNELNRILKISNDSDCIFHLGDNISDARYLQKNFNGTVYMVKGNCDYNEVGDVEQIVELKGKKFLLTHGDRYGVNYGLDKIFYRGLELEVDMIIFGHIHRKVYTKEGGICILNPGSISLPRDESKSIAKIILNTDDEIEVEFQEF
ncbi:MAG: metallophosphoesterase [Sarcina sp.]